MPARSVIKVLIFQIGKIKLNCYFPPGFFSINWLIFFYLKNKAIVGWHTLVAMYNFTTTSGALQLPGFFNGHNSDLNSVLQINTDQIVSSGLTDWQIIVWNITSRALVNKYRCYLCDMMYMLILPNGLLASIAAGSKIYVWNFQTSTLSENPVIPSGSTIYAFLVNPYDGSLVVDFTGYINFYDCTTFALIKSFNLGANNYYFGFAVIPSNGNIIAAGNSASPATVDVWNPSGSKISSTDLSVSASLPCIVILLPDNITAVLTQADNSLVVFDVLTKTVGTSYVGHIRPCLSLELTPDYLYVLSIAMDSLVIIWQWKTMSLTLLGTYSYEGTASSSLVIVTNPYIGNYIVNFIL
jgi:hypothetical protein